MNLIVFLAITLFIFPISPVCYTTNGLTTEQKTFILQTHNDFRQKVASGNEAGQPTATNMKVVAWDKELETLAQGYADTCPDGHNPSRKTASYDSCGENLYWLMGAAVLNVTAAVEAWYLEVKNFPSSKIDPFIWSEATGHYTQVVWGATTKIGCGSSQRESDKKYFVVCNQQCAGNVVGGSMQKSGTAASACTTASSKTYTALCDEPADNGLPKNAFKLAAVNFVLFALLALLLFF